MEVGVKRWYVNISQWNPSPGDFFSAMSVLPQHEHSSITRYVRMQDRKRALISRLLQYTLVLEVLEIPFDAIVMKRTQEGKPYLDCNYTKLELPNFNFNVSHHGDIVAIASEPLCLVGLDIVCHDIPEKDSILDFIGNFKSYFSCFEWDRIMKPATSDEILAEFYRYWCLKEAFVKALGTGLAYNLANVEFHHTNWENITVHIGGEYKRDWRFWLFELEQGHRVAIARGNPGSATESYKQTLKRVVFSEGEYYKGLHLPNVGFKLRTVNDLFSAPYAADYGGSISS